MRASTIVLLPSQLPPPSAFHGIDILAHIPHGNSCQIPSGFILLIFDLPTRADQKQKQRWHYSVCEMVVFFSVDFQPIYPWKIP